MRDDDAFDDVGTPPPKPFTPKRFCDKAVSTALLKPAQKPSAFVFGSFFFFLLLEEGSSHRFDRASAMLVE